MPKVALSGDARRALVLRALAGENKTALGREYGISRVHVHRLVRETEARLEAEYAFWSRVHDRANQR